MLINAQFRQPGFYSEAADVQSSFTASACQCRSANKPLLPGVGNRRGGTDLAPPLHFSGATGSGLAARRRLGVQSEAN